MQSLNSGDVVELIAPASRCSDNELAEIKALIESWGLVCLINETIFGQDLLCANSDALRFKLLEKALLNPNTKAIICVRGGYGSMRLIPKLEQMSKPQSPKLFVGMSDITALHLFFQQHWGWPTIHASASPAKCSSESLASLKAILFGESESIVFKGLKALNQKAQAKQIISSIITGGNLCLLQTSLGTTWELDANNKILLIEEIGERAYKVDRMLEQLHQAKRFEGVQAIIFADFLTGLEPDGSSLIQPVLERFAQSCDFPVLQLTGIGHGFINYPIFLGKQARLQFGDDIILTV